MKDLKLNDPVAIVIGGSIAFGVVSELLDRTTRDGTSRSVMVEVAKEDPKHLHEDQIPERDGYLIKRDELIRKIDSSWQWNGVQGLADVVANAYLFHWALARSAELNAPPVAQVDTARPADVGDNPPGSL